MYSCHLKRSSAGFYKRHTDEVLFITFKFHVLDQGISLIESVSDHSRSVSKINVTTAAALILQSYKSLVLTVKVMFKSIEGQRCQI